MPIKGVVVKTEKKQENADCKLSHKLSGGRKEETKWLPRRNEDKESNKNKKQEYILMNRNHE